jgi:putative peptidoglycan lipid II flippase
MKEHANAPTVQSSARSSTESIKRAGAKNVFISIFVAGASFYSLTLIAKYFGGSVGSDAYFFLASLSTLASGIIGSLMGTVFLPAFIKLLTHSDKSEAYRFASSIFSWCLLISCLIAIPTIIWNEQFFKLVSQFDATQILQTDQVLKYFAPIFLLSVMSELFRVIALSIGKFSTAALTAIFPPFFLICSLVFFGGVLQEVALVASLMLAKIAALIMLVVMVSRHGVLIRFNLTRNLDTFQFLKSSTPYWSANVVTNAATFYFDYQASGLGTGVVSALAYANRVFMLPITIFLNPLVEISRTRFAQLQANGELVTFNNFYNYLITFTVYFSVPIASIYLLFSEEIISALFQRGAFQAESVKIAASCLSIYAWSIPFLSVFQINGRACESYQRLVWPSIFGTIGNLLMIVAAFFLTQKFGYIGIPIARVVIEVIYFLPFGFTAIQLFGGSPRYINIIKSLIFTLISITPAIYISHMIFPPGYDGTPFPPHLLIIILISYSFIFALFFILISSQIRRRLYSFIILRLRSY